MKAILLFIALCCSCIAAQAQETYFKISTVTLKDKATLPVVYHKKARKASESINAYLQLATIGALVKDNKDSLSNPYSFTILENNKRYISILCQPSNMDSTSLYPVKSMAFNAATGQVISLTDLFSINGLADLKKIVLRQHADEIKAAQQAGQEEALTKCLKNNLNHYSLKQGMLSIQSGGCFAEATDKSITRVPVQPIENLLSNYGFGVFGLNPKIKMKKMVTNSLPNLYSGTIGEDKVLLQLDPVFEKSLGGVLYNTKTGRSIRLQGSFKSNHFDAEGAWGKLSVVISNGMVQGNYREPGSRSKPVNLAK